MNENWYALCVAILNPKQLSIEKSFEKLDNGRILRWRKFTKDDLEDMYKLRQQGVAFREIGPMYGTSDSSICHLLKKYKEERGLC